jgi:glutathione peroxidase
MHVSFFLTLVFVLGLIPAVVSEKQESRSKFYEFTMKTIDGKDKLLSDYKGKVLMVVNVASKCGHTPQYKGLEAVYQKYGKEGFMILGFPANNFFRQEPGTDSEIKQFCTTKYNVTFDMFSKISVKGDDQHPLYQYLTKESPFPGDVKWNFQKYLVDRNGSIVAKFDPKVEPEDTTIIQAVEKYLNQ